MGTARRVHDSANASEELRIPQKYIGLTELGKPLPLDGASFNIFIAGSGSIEAFDLNWRRGERHTGSAFKFNCRSRHGSTLNKRCWKAALNNISAS